MFKWFQSPSRPQHKHRSHASTSHSTWFPRSWVPEKRSSSVARELQHAVAEFRQQGSERMKITERSGTVWVVKRGRDGYSIRSTDGYYARSHYITDVIYTLMRNIDFIEDISVQ